MSIKSGMTMGTTASCEVDADIFNQNYRTLELSIQNLSQQKEKVVRDIRNKNIQIDFTRRKFQTIESSLNIRESFLLERKQDYTQDELDLEQAHAQLEEIEGKQYDTLQEIEDLKLELDDTYSKIAVEMNEEIKVSPIRNDIPLLTASIEFLTNSIRNRSIHLLQKEEIISQKGKELEDIVKEENELKKNKQNLDKQINQIDERRVHTTHILTEPIETLDYEEQTVQSLESDLQIIQEKYIAVVNETGIEDPGALVAQIERLEQQNIKRRTLFTRHKDAITAQTAILEKKLSENEREREKLENAKAKRAVEEMKKKEKERKLHEQNQLQDVNPQTLMEKIEQSQKEKQAKIDQITQQLDDVEKTYQQIRKQKEERWQRKMKRIDTYTRRLNKKEGIDLNINEMTEKVDDLKQQLATYTQQVEQLKRRKKASLSFKAQNNEITQNLQSFNEALESKKQKLDIQQGLIEDRKDALKDRTHEVNQIEKEVDETQRRTSELESEVDNLQTKINQVVAQMNEETEKLDTILASIPKVSP